MRSFVEPGAGAPRGAPVCLARGTRTAERAASVKAAEGAAERAARSVEP